MPRKFKVVVCRGPECGERRNSAIVAKAFDAAISDLTEVEVQMQWQSCFGRCSFGPNVLVREVDDTPARKFLLATLPTKGGKSTMYNGMTPDRVLRVCESHLQNGQPVKEFMQPLVVLPPIPDFAAKLPSAANKTTAPESAESTSLLESHEKTKK